jgi:glycosyltransferase involved in cell wall biosynthesis
MRISCLLLSYNRPRLIRQALRSVAEQGYSNYELILLDESTLFDASEVLREFEFSNVKVRKFHATPLERSTQNRIGTKLNEGLSLATGDLVCYLCDDDYYFPGWFEAAARFFEDRPEVQVGYGRLVHSHSQNYVFQVDGAHEIFPGIRISKPGKVLDHNQVIHRRFSPPYLWPLGTHTIESPDGYYWSELAREHVFYPIDAMAAVKRLHELALSRTIQQGRNDFEGLRE